MLTKSLPPTAQLSARGHATATTTTNKATTPDAMQASAGERTTKRKAKAKGHGQGKEMSVEEIFASVSSVQASGLNPPPARTVLTPRSAESCLKNGINPEILRIRDLESFFGMHNKTHRRKASAHAACLLAPARACRAVGGAGWRERDSRRGDGEAALVTVPRARS
jgi:hypothetical protein